MTGKNAKLGGRTEGTEGDPASKMCEPCRDKFRALTDQQRPCDRPGCESTWTWPIQAQLEAFATRRPPPQRLCAEDEAKLGALADVQVGCSVPGCKRSWLFSRRAQLIAGAPGVEPVPPPAMCGPCANVYDKIADRPVTCGIRGCKKKWSWSRDEQIQDYAAGESNEPPRRLCESCKGVFGAIAHREVRCRTSGCKNTWTWPREAQLDAAIADKPLPKAPHRMCQRCIDLYSSLRDVERPCRRPGCKRTWTDKRGAQLARAVRGKTGDPYPHYCAECEKEMGELEEQHVPCKTEHCPGTWTWTAAQQLAAGVRPTPKPESGLEGESGDAHGGDPRRQDRRKLGRGAEGDAPLATGALNGSALGGPERAVDAEVQAVADEERGGNGDAEDNNEDRAQDDAQDGGENRAPDGADAGADAVTRTGTPADKAAVATVAGVAHAAGVAQAAGVDRKRRRRKRRREIRPPERRCDDCLAFLTDRKTKEIPCTGCKTPIHWPPESQLQTHLGNWAEPSLCGACKRDLTEAARVAEREALRHGGHLVTATAAGDRPQVTAEPAMDAAVASPDQSGSTTTAPVVSEEDGSPVNDAHP